MELDDELTTLNAWADRNKATYPLAVAIKLVFSIPPRGTTSSGVGRPAILYSIAKLDKAYALVTGFKNDEASSEVTSIDCSSSPEGQ